MNLRFEKKVSFDADFDFGIIKAIQNGRIKILPDITLTQDVEIRIYILSPNGDPLIIFDKVLYSLFIGMWGPKERIEVGWEKFPTLKLAVFCDKSCIAYGDVTVKGLMFLCLNLAKYSVIDPCDPDGRRYNAITAALRNHRPKPEGVDQP